MVRRPVFWVSLLLVSVVMFSEGVFALQSNNYRIDESAISTGSMLQSSSTNYRAIDGINDIAIGTSSSSNYQDQAGSKTSPDPWLSFRIVASNANFGILSPTTTATATASFSVLNYTSYGYVVQVAGQAPTNGAHSISSMNIRGSSQSGIEQFGINLGRLLHIENLGKLDGVVGYRCNLPKVELPVL